MPPAQRPNINPTSRSISLILIVARLSPRSSRYISYHFYGALSRRCAFQGKQYGTSPDEALSPAWLSRTDQVFDFYKALQVKYAPGTPIWVTETAEAACGGDRWASTFLDSFRYLDQMGRLAMRGVGVIFHNTLAVSDYGLIDQQTLEPRPDYWAALLWKRLMSRVVLDAGPPVGALHVYAHCLRGVSGGVAVLAINTSRTEVARLIVRPEAELYTLSAPHLESTKVQLNGADLELLKNGELPPIDAVKTLTRHAYLRPATITFIAMGKANNTRCKAAK